MNYFKGTFFNWTVHLWNNLLLALYFLGGGIAQYGFNVPFYSFPTAIFFLSLLYIFVITFSVFFMYICSEKIDKRSHPFPLMQRLFAQHTRIPTFFTNITETLMKAATQHVIPVSIPEISAIFFPSVFVRFVRKPVCIRWPRTICPVKQVVPATSQAHPRVLYV